MYYYYVRFSIFVEGTAVKITDGRTQVVIPEEITDISQIEMVEQEIIKETKISSNFYPLVDFYHLLRKDPN